MFKFNFEGETAEEEGAPPPPEEREAARVVLESSGPPCQPHRFREVLVEGEGYFLGESSSSLLVQAGVYEGGSELWECSVDLARFVSKTIGSCRDLSVVELGCGRGESTF